MLQSKSSSRFDGIFSLYGPPVPSTLLDLVELWSIDQVADWLRGLDDCVLPYVHFFTNAQVDGPQLLMMSQGELMDMGISSLGVRQVIIQAIDVLSHLCYNMETENLQSLAMLVGVKARNLLNDLRWICENQESHWFRRTNKDTIHSLNTICTGVSYLVEETKKIISWLDRSPLDHIGDFVQLRNRIMKYTVKVLKCTQVPSADMFLTAKCLINLATKIHEECDVIVCQLNDPLILQTAWLERAVLRRKNPEQELGFNLLTSYKGLHMVTEVKFKSPADISGKVDAGDEILQFNGQTVIGWDLRKLVAALNQFGGSEVVLLLKKRPRDFSFSAYRSQPGTPKMIPKRLMKGGMCGNHVGARKDGSTSSAESPGPVTPIPKRLKKKDRKRSSSFTSIPQTPVEKRVIDTFRDSADTPPRKLTVPAKTELPELPKILVPDLQKFGLDEEPAEVPAVTVRQRRASVSGGSPILKRMSAHLGTSGIACPRPRSQWVELLRGSSGKGGVQMPESMDPSGAEEEPTRIRRKKLARVPTKLRPASFINNQLVLPPPARMSVASSTSTESLASDTGLRDVGIDLRNGPAEKDHLPSDDEVFAPEPQKSRVIVGKNVDVILSGEEGEDFASVELADVEELQRGGLGDNLDVADWSGLTATSRPASDSEGSSVVRVLTEQEEDSFYGNGVTEECRRNRKEVETNGNEYFYKSGPDWNEPLYEGIQLSADSSKNAQVAGSLANEFVDLDSSFVSTTTTSEDRESVSTLSALSTDSRRKITQFFGEYPPTTPDKVQTSSPSASTGVHWSSFLTTSNKVDLTQRSEEKVRDALGISERNSPVLTGMRNIGSTYRREFPSTKAVSEPMLKVSRGERTVDAPPRGSRVDWKTLEPLSRTPCDQVMTSADFSGWLRRARLPAEELQEGRKWRKQFLVLAGGVLYVYKRQGEQCAELVVWLPDFIACPAEPEYRTHKKNVFKLCDAVTTFYFSSEHKQEMYQWLKKLGLAAISFGSQKVSRGSKQGAFYLSEVVGGREKRECLSESPKTSVFGTLPRGNRSRNSPSAGEIFSSLRKSLRTASPRKREEKIQLSRENSTGSTKSRGSLDGRIQVSDPLKPRKISGQSAEDRGKRARLPEEFR